MPMFPDSGVPAADARNSIDVNTPAGCDELWYSTSRCQPRFDPAAANAMLAENMNLVMKGLGQYDCSSLTNVERAVRYINQRGLPRGVYIVGGPLSYTGVLDPPITGFNDFMTLTIVPSANNGQGGTFINLGIGATFILRNDGNHLERDDLRAGRPEIIAFWAGYWYVCGMVPSQVPLLVKGGISAWVRTDGNDITGDGTANSADKAFKTIAGAWYAIGSRYAATPLFSINIRLGIPGTYEGTAIGPFGGTVTLTGDETNPQAYRISRFSYGPGAWAAFAVGGIASCGIRGVTFEMTTPPPDVSMGLRVLNASVAIGACRWEVMVGNAANGYVNWMEGGGKFTGVKGTLTFVGNGLPVGCLFACNTGHFQCSVLNPGERCDYYFNDFTVGAGMTAQFLSTMSVVDYRNQTGWNVNNVTGPGYSINTNSILNMGGHALLGSTAGAAGTGAQFIA